MMPERPTPRELQAVSLVGRRFAGGGAPMGGNDVNGGGGIRGDGGKVEPIVRDVEGGQATGQMFRCAAEIEPEVVDWLWFPYIAKGKLTMLEGDPGLGKSWLTCALAAGVSRGFLPAVTRESEPVRFNP